MGNCLQDLACTKCREVTQYNMAKRCKCAGDFGHTTKISDTAQLIKTFYGIAQHFQMPLLLEQVDWLFKMNTKLAAEINMKI